jgi:hypothetical protein
MTTPLVARFSDAAAGVTSSISDSASATIWAAVFTMISSAWISSARARVILHAKCTAGIA